MTYHSDMLKPGKKVKVLKDKTKGQTLRAVLFLYWEQTGSKESSEEFYERHMTAIIDAYKGKLKK